MMLTNTLLLKDINNNTQMASKENEPSNITVTWEDQKKICRFHRLHKRECEVDDDLAILKQRVVCFFIFRIPSIFVVDFESSKLYF